jgi:hypothetical protein
LEHLLQFPNGMNAQMTAVLTLKLLSASSWPDMSSSALTWSLLTALASTYAWAQNSVQQKQRANS